MAYRIELLSLVCAFLLQLSQNKKSTHDQCSRFLPRKLQKNIYKKKGVKKTNQASIDLWFNQLGKKLLSLNLKRNRRAFISFFFFHKIFNAKITLPWRKIWRDYFTWESCAESSDSGCSSSCKAVKECLRSNVHQIMQRKAARFFYRERERANLFPDKKRKEFKQSSSPRWKLRRYILNWHSL